ncbi:efflux RND transporter periplasmic adaptor subunit [Salidesulfovibrio brasiliensis]|uniref:efflux RND transporter periplasmic adaptor subunit n=1 Tax=Salidesulfovibrio brasiliensis TaxID=221711 RepID=UPI0006D20388|nr:efflux RND transporter periplasmic adaptor subunit [Salidesulfovibrio brasiliensis]
MRRILLLFVVVSMLISAGCGGDRQAEAEDGSTATKADALEVAAVEPAEPRTAMKDRETFVVRKAAREAILTGFTRARNTMTLVAEVEGRVEEVKADVGDTLDDKGVFAVLDNTFVNLDLQKNRADQAKLRSELEYHRKELDRYKELVEGRTAAQSTLDNNVRNFETTRQQLRAMQVEERRLMERLVRHTIKGPSGWKVVSRELEPGEWVSVGQTAGTLGNFKQLLVPFALSSAEYRTLMDMGKTVTLKLPDHGGTVEASIERVAPGFDPETRKINVDLEIAGGELEMRGGVRAQLVLPLPDPGGSVLVPRSALVKAYEEHFLVNPDGERVRVMLLGTRGDDLYRVSSPDVRPGDRFILNPNG